MVKRGKADEYLEFVFEKEKCGNQPSMTCFFAVRWKKFGNCSHPTIFIKSFLFEWNK